MIKAKESKFENFTGSVYFIALSFIIGVISYTLGIQLLGFIYVVLIGSYILITQKNLLPVIPLIFTFVISIRDLGNFTKVYVLIPLFLPAVFAIVYHFIKFPTNFKFGKLFIPLLLVTFSLFVGGIGSPYRKYFAEGLAHIITASIVPIFLYLYFFNGIDTTDKEFTKRYFAEVMILLALNICLEIIILIKQGYFCIIDDGRIFNLKDGMWKLNELQLGWLNVGFSGYLLMLGIATTLYYMVENNKIIISLICLGCIYACLFISKNHGAFGVSLFMLPFALLFSYFRLNKEKRKLLNVIIFLGIIGSIFIVYLLIRSGWLYSFLTQELLDDTGRTGIYKAGIFLFKDSPIFGGSLGAVFHVDNVFTLQSGYMHSTLLEVLCTMGIVGLIIYVIYFIFRIRIFTCSDNNFNFYLFIGFLMFECYAMIDNGEFSFLMVFITLYTLIVEITKEDSPVGKLPSKFFTPLI